MDDRHAECLRASARHRHHSQELLQRVHAGLAEADKRIAISSALIRESYALLHLVQEVRTTDSMEPLGRLWELRGNGGVTLDCVLTRTPTGAYRLVVCRAGTELIAESFRDATTTAARASQLAHDLLQLGWTTAAPVSAT